MSAMPVDPVAAAAAVEVVDKGFVNLRARCAMAGVQLHIVRGLEGRAQFLAARWGWSRTFDDLAAVADWLARMEGPR